MKKGSINQCVITLTRKCNLRCRFCYAQESGYGEQDYIGFDDLVKIVDFCNDLGINDIVLSGGEPTLYRDLIKLLKYIGSRERIMSVSMSSNGINLSDFDYCKELIDNGVKYIDISLKGNNEEICSRVAGSYCLDAQCNAISNLSTLPVTLTCSMVLTDENVFGFCDAIEKAYKSGARQFSFSFALDNIVSEEKNINYLEKHNPCKLVDDFISQIDRLEAITDGEWWIEYTFPLCVYSKEQLNILKGRLAEPCQIFNGLGITFDTKMNLIPCSMFLNDYLGKFGMDFSSVGEFVEFSEKEEFKNFMESLKVLPDSNCTTCDMIEKCNGGCPIFWKNTTFESFMTFKDNYRKINR